MFTLPVSKNVTFSVFSFLFLLLFHKSFKVVSEIGLFSQREQWSNLISFLCLWFLVASLSLFYHNVQCFGAVKENQYFEKLETHFSWSAFSQERDKVLSQVVRRGWWSVRKSRISLVSNERWFGHRVEHCTTSALMCQPKVYSEDYFMKENRSKNPINQKSVWRRMRPSRPIWFCGCLTKESSELLHFPSEGSQILEWVA